MLAGSKDNFLIVSADGNLQLHPGSGSGRVSTPSRQSMNKQMYTFGGRTNVRGNEMYDFMRSKYRPLSSQKNAIRYQYPRAASHDRAAAAVAQARNNPMIRTSYEDNFKKGAQQIPYPFHPRPTAQTMAAKRKTTPQHVTMGVEEEDKPPQRFN